MQLLAIARQSQKSADPGWPQGDYILYYWGTGGRFEQLFAQDGKAVLACWLCGQPQEDLKRPGVEFIPDSGALEPSHDQGRAFPEPLPLARSRIRKTSLTTPSIVLGMPTPCLKNLPEPRGRLHWS